MTDRARQARALNGPTRPAVSWAKHGHWLGREALKLRRRIKRKLGALAPLRIDIYPGFGGAQRAILRGRALEAAPPTAPEKDDNAWDNLRRSWRQLRSDSVPGLSLSVRLDQHVRRVVTDRGGYFLAEFELNQALDSGWHAVSATVDELDAELAQGSFDQGQLFVPPSSARFGVISDIDDTILQTHVRNRPRQVYLTLFGNAITRLSFEGTAELFRGMQRAGEDAPFFYVSRSAWNIHPLLEHFIAHQGLPRGPLVLRDVGFLQEREARRGHKKREIERILNTYPGLPFIFVGDSGQKDAFIYADFARRAPRRVKAILIRNVSWPSRRARVEAELSSLDTPSLVFRSSREARKFLAGVGLWAEAPR